MKHSNIISQLKSLKENSRSFLATEEPDSVWHHDIEALDAAIKIVGEHPAMEKKLRELESRLKCSSFKDQLFRIFFRILLPSFPEPEACLPQAKAVPYLTAGGIVYVQEGTGQQGARVRATAFTCYEILV